MAVASIATTVLAAVFAAALLRTWWARRHRRRQLLWWGLGVVAYGAGTGAAALVESRGWNAAAFRTWYIAGALLGGALLAQGTVYLVHRLHVANRLAVGLMVAAGVAALLVLLSPVHALADDTTLNGESLGWGWIRAITPFLNVYAVVYLVGGAVWSAVRLARRGEGSRDRVVGNGLIALGGITPALGGLASRLGGDAALPWTLLAGLLLIWAGATMGSRPHPSG